MNRITNPVCPIVCIINSTNDLDEKHCGIEAKNWTENFLSHYNLKDNIEEYLKFIKLNTVYDLFNTISNTVNPSDKHIINIDDLYYTSDYVFQAIFKTVAKDIDCTYNNLVENSNKLATQLLGERHVVDGNMIIIKRSIINTSFDYVDVTMEDITSILRNQLIHTAVIIKDNEIMEQSYIYNPLEINFGQSHIDNVRYHEFRFLDFRLFFHVDTKAEQTKINKIATSIYGQNIYGNVLISLADNSDSTPVNLNMTSELIDKIYRIISYHRTNKSEIDKKKYGRHMEIKNKDLADYDPSIHTHFDHNEFPEITLCPNFFQVVKLEYNNIKDKFVENEILFDQVLNNVL